MVKQGAATTFFERMLPFLPWLLLWVLAPMPLYIWAIVALII
jgi:hypothetical protein